MNQNLFLIPEIGQSLKWRDGPAWYPTIFAGQLIKQANKVCQRYGNKRLLDIGTGSGVILTALALQYQGFEHMVGLDLEEPILVQAREIAVGNGVADKIQFQCCTEDSLGLDETDQFDLITINPPEEPWQLLPTLVERACDHLTEFGHILITTTTVQDPVRHDIDARFDKLGLCRLPRVSFRAPRQGARNRRGYVYILTRA